MTWFTIYLLLFAGNRFHPAMDSSQSQSQANVTSPSKRHLPPTPEASPKALDASPRGYVTMTGSDVYHSSLRHFKAESRDDGALVTSLVQSLAGSSSSGPHCYLNMINACWLKWNFANIFYWFYHLYCACWHSVCVSLMSSDTYGVCQNDCRVCLV